MLSVLGWPRNGRSFEGNSRPFGSREAKVETDLAFIQTKESMLAERFERRLETQVADVREQLEEARQILELERQRRQARQQELRTLRAELARYGEDPDSVKLRSDDRAQQLGALRDELSLGGRQRTRFRTPADGQGSCRCAGRSGALAPATRPNPAPASLSTGQCGRILEVLRDERDALLAQRETLRQAIEQQRTDWEELQAKESSKEPFPPAPPMTAMKRSTDPLTHARSAPLRTWWTRFATAWRLTRPPLSTTPNRTFASSWLDLRRVASTSCKASREQVKPVFRGNSSRLWAVTGRRRSLSFRPAGATRTTFLATTTRSRRSSPKASSPRHSIGPCSRPTSTGPWSSFWMR